MGTGDHVTPCLTFDMVACMERDEHSGVAFTVPCTKTNEESEGHGYAHQDTPSFSIGYDGVLFPFFRFYYVARESIYY